MGGQSISPTGSYSGGAADSGITSRSSVTFGAFNAKAQTLSPTVLIGLGVGALMVLALILKK